MRMLQLWVCNVIFRQAKLLSFPFDCLNDGGILFQSYCFNCKEAVGLIFFQLHKLQLFRVQKGD